MAYRRENNIKKTEMITIMNKYAYLKENSEVNHVTEIKKENSSFNSTFIDSENNHIQFESVVIKMEREDEYLEENVEERFDRPLINKDEITSVISQNDIHLTNSAIMGENVNQDYVEPFCEKIDNILEARDSINDNMQIKVEKNYDCSLYSEKCANDPLVHQNEIKIDVMDNDIKSVNGDRNNEFKIVNIEEISKKHVMPLKYEDKTDKETNLVYKILEGKEENIFSKNPKQKKSSVVNQKTKDIKKHKCYICKKNFLQQSSLIDHLQTHPEKKTHDCNICQMKFMQSFKLKKHMSSHATDNIHVCSVCQKKFNRLSILSKHMRMHTGEKPYECDVCQKKFSQSCNLKEHMKIHTEEKSYECSVCLKKFLRSYELRSHTRTHTGEKPHECGICEKKFAQSYYLTLHMKIHTGEKPHECDLCQKKFTHSSALRRHKRIHTGEKPYECDICQKKFAQSPHLRKHMNIHTEEKSHK